MSHPVIFLDDGGVMNDNTLRGTQWQRMVAEFFLPILGGTFEAWSEANRLVMTGMLEPDAWSRRIQAAHDYTDFDRMYQVDWLRGMCELVGVPMPPEEEGLELAHKAEASIIPRVRSAFPGAREAIRTLYERGYMLHTASGESSAMLAYYLEGMGVRDCFGRLYGPDLIDTFKDGPAYYERIFAHAGIDPTSALIVDDNLFAVKWATQVGARAILVSNEPRTDSAAIQCIGSLADLPEGIQWLD